MNSVTLDLHHDNEKARKSLKVWLLEKVQTWINALLRSEMDQHLGRAVYEPVQPENFNYRNGTRPRKLNLFGLGRMDLAVPRDRQSTFKSQLLPDRKGQDAEFEALLAECWLAGLSTHDISRITAKHFGQRYDSKQVSRIVERATVELDHWQRRRLADRKYKFLFVDGLNVKVRIQDPLSKQNKVSQQSFCVVLGVSEEDETYEVLSITMGDREDANLWADIFNDLQRRGLNAQGVELGIMDGLPGLEEVFARSFKCARTQRCQVHAKRNAIKRVRKDDRAAFKKDVDKVFYAPSEAEARKNFYAFRQIWQGSFPGAVSVIERDLDSLLRFYQFDKKYWTTIRSTNPIERLNKEIKRRTKSMEVTGGETSTYRVVAYVARTMEYSWSKHRLSQWANVLANRFDVHTQNAA
jgi:transposase-like protein